MANEMQLYSAMYTTLDARLLTQEASVSVEAKSGGNPVFTTVLGLAGMSQGAGTVEVTLESAVPSADFELNPGPYLRTLTVVELGVIMAGRQLLAKCFVTDATFQHGVNQESKLTMKFLGRLSDFE